MPRPPAGKERQPPPPSGARAEVLIHDLTSEGEGVARLEGWVVFIPGAVPGDRVLVEVERQRGGRLEGRLLQLLDPSADRVQPCCSHQGECGGCPLMVLDTRAALRFKARHLVETLRRIGGVEIMEPRVIPSPLAFEYRGRVRFAVDGARFGFRPRGTGGGFVAVGRCWLIQEQASHLARVFLESLAAATPPQSRPWPTQLELRGSPSRGKWLLMVFTPHGPFPELAPVSKDVLSGHPSLGGVIRRQEAGREIRNELLAGHCHIPETLGGVEVDCGAEGFLQVNPGAADVLYREVGDLARRGGMPRRILDLFCGAGLAGWAASSAESELVGVDLNRHSVEQARRLARATGRSRVRYAAADARATLRDLAEGGESFDLVISNPPRAGLGADLAPSVAALGPRAVLLISCHPATLARDMKGFVPSGFRVTALSAVDMFPQTPHLEAVALLERCGA